MVNGNDKWCAIAALLGVYTACRQQACRAAGDAKKGARPQRLRTVTAAQTRTAAQHLFTYDPSSSEEFSVQYSSSSAPLPPPPSSSAAAPPSCNRFNLEWKEGGEGEEGINVYQS